MPTKTAKRRNWLQCGRIYKDAEMTGTSTGRSSSLRLQCGRIYKDAEISTCSHVPHLSSVKGFNVAASIKMRKSGEPLDEDGRGHFRFNVAASIKMRK